MPAEAPPVRLEGASLRYPKPSPADAVALHEVDFRLPRGRLVVLAGPNGSGKTTLLRLVAGDLVPTSGTVRVFGEDPARRTAALRRRVAYVAQALALDPEMTAGETFDLFASLGGGSRDEAADAFGLSAHLDKRVARLSGGLKRRLHVAVGLLGERELLLLDEPDSGLDAEGQARLWALLAKRCSAGAAALVATHDPDVGKGRADRVLRMEGGRLAGRKEDA